MFNILLQSPEIWFSEKEFQARQKLRQDLPQRPRDIYVISQDLIQEQYLRALRWNILIFICSHIYYSSRLLRKEEVWVHSLGENIPTAITFLNKLKWVLSTKPIRFEYDFLSSQSRAECRQVRRSDLVPDLGRFQRQLGVSSNLQRSNFPQCDQFVFQSQRTGFNSGLHFKITYKGAEWAEWASGMLFRQKELLRWLGVSVFEIWVCLVCLTVFSVLLVLKVNRRGPDITVLVRDYFLDWTTSTGSRHHMVPHLLSLVYMWRSQCLLLHHCLHQTVSRESVQECSSQV